MIALTDVSRSTTGGGHGISVLHLTETKVTDHQLCVFFSSRKYVFERADEDGVSLERT